MCRIWIIKILTFFCVLGVFGIIHVIRAPQATAEAYKLGKVYYNCLETHSGAVSSSTGCSCATNKDCLSRGHGKYCNTSINICQQCKDGTDDSWCRNNFGEDYICMNGGCAIAECEKDSDCVNKYSHMYSCAKESGATRGSCQISCSWSTIVSQNSHLVNNNGISRNIVEQMKINHETFRDWIYQPQNVLPINRSSFYTCNQGTVSRCPNVYKVDSEDLTEKDICMPCSLYSGGTFGLGSDATIDTAGTMPYFVNGVETSFGTKYSYTGVSTFGLHGSLTGCCSKEAMNKSKNIASRLEQCHFFTDYSAGFYRNTQTVMLGNEDLRLYSPECMTYGIDGFESYNDSGTGLASNSQLSMTDLIWAVFVPYLDRQITVYNNSYPPNQQTELLNPYSKAIFCCIHPYAYAGNDDDTWRRCVRMK